MRIETGDVTLFAGNGHIFASATVVAKIHSQSLAIDLWQTNSKGETWEYIYFLDELTEHDIPYKEFNSTVGYQSNYVIQGFSILNEDKSDLFLNRFNLRSSIYFPEIPEQDYIATSTELDQADSLERQVIVNKRIEQQYLRRSLFGKKKMVNAAFVAGYYQLAYFGQHT